jgi:sugar-phosphatase
VFITVISCSAILFDLDGVLVDSRRCIELVWRTWAKGHGLDPGPIIRVAHGRRTSETLREVAPRLDVAAEVAVLDRLEESETRGVQMVPGAGDLLAAIPRTRWAVVTSGSPAVARMRLQLGRLPEPPVLITAADVRQGKPHPEGYLRAAESLGLAPTGCVVVEDAPAGIAAGRAAGMRVLAVRGTYTDDRLAEAEAILPALAAVRLRHVNDTGLELAIEETGAPHPRQTLHG